MKATFLFPHSEKSTTKSVNEITQKTIQEMSWDEIFMLGTNPVFRDTAIKTLKKASSKK